MIIDGHQFDPSTMTCECGMTLQRLADATPRRPAPTHEDGLHPGTVGKVYRQRSTGRLIHYRKPA